MAIMEQRARDPVAETPWPKPERAACDFYHSFDLPNGTAIDGAWDLRGSFSDYIGGVEVRGKSVFDMGTATGFLAFNAEQAGAARVVAHEMDRITRAERVPFRESLFWENKTEWDATSELGLDRQKAGFWYVWHALGSKVQALYCPIAELLYSRERYDVVFAGALMEHLADPVSAIGACCRLANEKAIIGFTPIHHSDEEFMKPLIEWTDSQHNYVWFGLSAGLYRRVFDNMGFDLQIMPCSIKRGDTLVHRSTLIATRR